MNVFIINGGQTFAHSGGMFNNTLTGWTVEVMKEKGFAYRVTNINDAFDPLAEVENFKWADVIIYHTPIWWFQLPNGMKRYIDEVCLPPDTITAFTAMTVEAARTRT